MAAKSYRVIAFSVGWLFACVASAADHATGYDLYLDCTGQHGTYAEGFCLGFVSGVFTMTGPDEGVCGPNTLQQGVMERIFINWANRHPERLNLSRGISVHLAFMEAYPCPVPSPQPRVSKIPPYKAPDQLMPPR